MKYTVSCSSHLIVVAEEKKMLDGEEKGGMAASPFSSWTDADSPSDFINANDEKKVLYSKSRI